MKTILIYNEFEHGLQYLVFDGDYSRFNKIFINGYANKKEEKLANELCDLIYAENGELIVDFLQEFPVDVVKHDSVIVIECGFIP